MGKRILMIVLAVLLLAAMVGGVVFYLYVLQPKDKVDVGEFYNIPETFMTDLATGSHIRVEVRLELPDKKTVEEVGKRETQIVDAIYRILRSKTREELAGAEGQDRLRQDMENDLNQLLTTGQIKRLYFYQIVID
jgi:flagellar FliL protein